MNINKTKKATWKELYSAYRAHKAAEAKSQQAWDLYHETGDMTAWEATESAGAGSRTHERWLDALDAQRIDVFGGLIPGKSLSIAPDVLCKHAHQRSPLIDHTPEELYNARMHKYRTDFINLQMECVGNNSGYGFFGMIAEARKLPELTRREWEAYLIINDRAKDISAYLSVFQTIELIERGQFSYGAFCSHSRGHEIQRKLP